MPLGAPPAPPASPPPRERWHEWLRRAWRARGQLSGFRYWLWLRGVPFLLAVAAIFCLNGLVNGWTAAYDLLTGIASPSAAPAPVEAWFLSVAGWLLVPGIAGAVAGYIVTDFIGLRRSRSIEDIFGESDRG